MLFFKYVEGIRKEFEVGKKTGVFKAIDDYISKIDKGKYCVNMSNTALGDYSVAGLYAVPLVMGHYKELFKGLRKGFVNWETKMYSCNSDFIACNGINYLVKGNTGHTKLAQRFTELKNKLESNKA